MFSVSSLEAAACTTSALNHLLSLLPRMAESRAQLIKADHVPSTGTKKCASFVLSPANVERGLIFRVRPSQCILGNTRHRPCWTNVGPASTTLAQHCSNTESMYLGEDAGASSLTDGGSDTPMLFISLHYRSLQLNG